MSDLRNAFAAYPDEPKVEPSSEPEVSPAEGEVKEEAEGATAATPAVDGGQNEEKGEATEQPKVGEPKAEKVDKNKLTARQKAQYTFSTIDAQRKKYRDDFRKVMEALEKSKGMKYDPQKMSIEEYVAMAVERGKLETANEVYENQGKLLDEQYERGLEALRDSQAQELWGNDPKALQEYNVRFKPQYKAMMEFLDKENPTVARYVRASENSALFEKLFLDDGGMAVFQMVNSNDPQMTWERMSRLERTELEKLKANAAPAAPEKPPMPSRATGSAVRTEANPETDVSISHEKLRRMFG